MHAEICYTLSMKKVLVLPGWMTGLRLYKDGGDFEVNIGKLEEKNYSADFVVGLSLGALIALQDVERVKGKLILINPPLPKRSRAVWLLRWVKYMITEGFFLRRQKLTINPVKYIRAIIQCTQILNCDFSETLNRIPKDKVVVVRGNNDTSFCDEGAADYLRSKNIRVMEVPGAHNWNEEIEKEIIRLMDNK